MIDRRKESIRITQLHYMVFDKLAALQNFRKTAKELNISISIVSKYIKDLESFYSVTLFQRTTRSVCLSEEAKNIWPRIKEIISLEAEIKSDLEYNRNIFIGRLKIGIPHTYFKAHLKYLASQCVDQEYVQIDWVIGNYLPYLVMDNFDAVIYCGALPSGDFYAKKIGKWRKIICASPEYLSKNSAVKTPADLLKSQCLDHTDNFKSTWILDDEYPINIMGKCSSSVLLVDMALNSLGICYLPSFTVQEYLDKGQLVEVLSDHSAGEFDIHLVSAKPFTSNRKSVEILKLFFSLDS